MQFIVGLLALSTICLVIRFIEEIFIALSVLLLIGGSLYFCYWFGGLMLGAK